MGKREFGDGHGGCGDSSSPTTAAMPHKSIVTGPSSPAGDSASTAAPRTSTSPQCRALQDGDKHGGVAGKRSRGSSTGSDSSDSHSPVKWAHRRTGSEVWRCRKGMRSDIKPSEWEKHKYWLKDEVLTRPIHYDSQTVPIPRVKRADITPEWFHENVASKGRPIILEGACSHWPAMQHWSIEALEEHFRHVSFKVAKNDKGKKLRMKFKYYADYVARQRDDSPLYLFETNVEDNGYMKPLLNDYEVPDVFPHDWFCLMNEDSRPPYRWFCMGPKRSGTTMHTDPLGTSAWNAVTHGCKHWVLFEPHESRRVVKGKGLVNKGEDDEAIMYYDFILPRIKQAHPNVKVYEGLQNPGDIIFVPGDWWHGVLNREDTVAVTQNYCGPDNFDVVWKKTRKQREKVAYLWLRNMKKYAPNLYRHAVELNRRDGFRMRHERAEGEKLSSCSSSSNDSSSDSTSDEAADLNPRGGGAVVPPETLLGVAAYKWQGTLTPPTNAVHKDRSKRPRFTEV